MKRFLAIALSLTMMLCLVACGGTSSGGGAASSGSAAPSSGSAAPSGGGTSDETFVLKFANVNNEQYPYHPASELFKERVEKATGGKVTVELYPGGTLGSETELVEQTMMGTLDMCVVASAPVANFIDSFKVFDLPFLFKDIDQQYAVFDSEIGQNMLAQMDGVMGVTGLGFWTNGVRSPSANTPINSMADLKGVKIRVMENDIHLAAYKAIGAAPTTMAWSEVFTAVQQGTVDGFESSPVIYSTGKYYEIQKHYGMINMLYSPAILMINSDKLKSMPEEYQKAILDAAAESTIYERDIYADVVEAALADVTANGMAVTTPDTAEFREAVQPVYEQFADSVGGMEFIKSIQNYEG